MRTVWVVAGLLVGCGGGAPSASKIVALYGEVHVHQFAGGSHPGALVVEHAVDASGVSGDTILPSPFPVVRREGACTLTLPVGSDPDQASGIDGGPIHVVGGTALPALDLDFTALDDTYLPAPPFAPGVTIFSGGEPLEIASDGAQAPPFSGEVRAPMPLELTAPRALSLAQPLTVAWRPDHADRVDAELVASTGAGAWGLVECVAADEDGTLTVPPSLLAALPPAPRDLQLIVTRDNLEHAPSSAAGEGVVLHAGWEVNLLGHEE